MYEELCNVCTVLRIILLTLEKILLIVVHSAHLHTRIYPSLYITPSTSCEKYTRYNSIYMMIIYTRCLGLVGGTRTNNRHVSGIYAPAHGEHHTLDDIVKKQREGRVACFMKYFV